MDFVGTSHNRVDQIQLEFKLKKIIGIQKFKEKLGSLTFTYCVAKVQAHLISGQKSWYVIIKSESDSCYPINFD